MQVGEPWINGLLKCMNAVLPSWMASLFAQQSKCRCQNTHSEWCCSFNGFLTLRHCACKSRQDFSSSLSRSRRVSQKCKSTLLAMVDKNSPKYSTECSTRKRARWKRNKSISFTPCERYRVRSSGKCLQQSDKRAKEGRREGKEGSRLRPNSLFALSAPFAN